jgi:hypothetical protein
VLVWELSVRNETEREAPLIMESLFGVAGKEKAASRLDCGDVSLDWSSSTGDWCELTNQYEAKYRDQTDQEYSYAGGGSLLPGGELTLTGGVKVRESLRPSDVTVVYLHFVGLNFFDVTPAAGRTSAVALTT